MRKLTLAALAATLALGLAPAFAGEGSPDIALPYAKRDGNATVGYAADNGYAANSGYAAHAAYGQARVAPQARLRTWRSDTNTGAVARQQLDEDESGLNSD